MKNKKESMEGRFLAEKIIQKSLSSTAWIFCLLADFGEFTIDALYHPSIYADFPRASFNLTDRGTFKKKKSKFKETAIRQSVWRLNKLGFVKKSEGKISLTDAGKLLAGYILARKKVMDKKWDGKYRVVIFDIPEEKRKIRDWLRDELSLLQYKKLQKSVFISKCSLTEDLIKKINDKKIGSFVNYLLVEKLYKNIF